MGYKYYDTPEGHDIFKKLGVTMKYATATGLIISTVDVLAWSRPQGYVSTIGRYAYYTVPLVGMAAAFTSTTYMATNIRQKDDKLNYVIGACAAAGVFGAWQRSVIAGTWAAIFFSVAGVLKKSSIQDGWTFINPPPSSSVPGALNTFKYDWTVMKDRPGNWTK